MSVLGCSRFGTIKDQATEDSSAILIGEPFEQSRGLVWFERRRGHGAIKLSGGGLLGRLLWKCRRMLSSAWRDVTAMPEPARRVGGGHVGGSGVQRGSQTLNSSRRDGSESGLDLRPAGLDGREVGGIAGQVPHCQPRRRDGVLDRLVLVGREVVDDQNGIGLLLAQNGQHGCLEETKEDGDRGSGRHRRHRHHAVEVQGAQDGQALPVDRRLAARPFANRRPGGAPCHVRQHPTLIQEDQSVWIDCRNFFAEVIPFGGNIRPPLLTRPQSLFLTTKPWRRNARHILDSLISAPVLAVKAWVYSARVASFFAATSERNTAPSSSSRIDGNPRPCGLGSRRPSRRSCRNQLPTALSEISKRRAMAAWLSAPPSHARKTRSRKSVE